jgi:ABC-type phosphate/phosphonate transport system permease subunit
MIRHDNIRVARRDYAIQRLRNNAPLTEVQKVLRLAACGTILGLIVGLAIGILLGAR